GWDTSGRPYGDLTLTLNHLGRESGLVSRQQRSDLSGCVDLAVDPVGIEKQTLPAKHLEEITALHSQKARISSRSSRHRPLEHRLRGEERCNRTAFVRPRE